MESQSSLNNYIYSELGVKTIIQAGGTKTTFSGPRLDNDVLEAMQEAAKSSVDIIELNKKVGEYIAKITHAEAGMVTSGAASGVVLSIAACMTGCDHAKIMKLPDSTGMKNELIMQKIHRGHYSHMYSFPGVRIIEVGDLVNCTVEEVEDSISEKTAAINFLLGPKIYQTGLTLEDLAKIAKKYNLPLIVDAAAMLPPKENLWKFIEEGADLVTISGGKAIKGPQNSGLLFGRKDLIEAARLNCSPYHSIGRPHKVSKESIVGLYAALKKFIVLDEENLYEQCRQKLYKIIEILDPSSKDIAYTIEHDFQEFSTPVLLLKSNSNGLDFLELVNLLKINDPPIYLEYHKRHKAMVINPFSLQLDEPVILALSLLDLIKGKLNGIKV